MREPHHAKQEQSSPLARVATSANPGLKSDAPLRHGVCLRILRAVAPAVAVRGAQRVTLSACAQSQAAWACRSRPSAAPTATGPRGGPCSLRSMSDAKAIPTIANPMPKAEKHTGKLLTTHGRPEAERLWIIYKTSQRPDPPIPPLLPPTREVAWRIFHRNAPYENGSDPRLARAMKKRF